MSEFEQMLGKMPTVIVVEDDASLRQAIGRILRAGGLTAVTYASAEAALAADATMANCLVLDIQLPGMSGFEMYRRLMQSGEKLPTIFITAHDEPAARQEAERIGAANYLPKPFTGRTLLDAVAQALQT